MKAGRMRFQFLIQNPEPAHTTSGQYTAGWTDSGMIWGDMEGLSGREKFFAAQSGSLATHIVKTRWTGLITGRSRLLMSWGAIGSGAKLDRVVDGTRVLNVEGVVDPDNRHRELRISCVEQV